MNPENFEKNELAPEGIISRSDVVVNSESGLAALVIKPDAFKHRGLIIKRLENSGLYIAKTVTKRLPDNFVIGEMYKNLPKDLEEATLEHFNLGPSEIVLVEGGPDLLKKIVTLTGEKTNPAECDEGSIRFLFGEHIPRKTKDGNNYSYNAVHRAKNEEEGKDNIKGLGSFM